MLSKTCLECGKEFEPNTHNQIYCSKKCKDIARSRRQNLKRPNNLTVKRVCVICGKEYLPNSSFQKTCSQKCRELLKKQREKINNDKKLESSTNEQNVNIVNSILLQRNIIKYFVVKTTKKNIIKKQIMVL